jgi:hypothetical protein
MNPALPRRPIRPAGLGQVYGVVSADHAPWGRQSMPATACTVSQVQRFRQRLAQHHFPISAFSLAVESLPPPSYFTDPWETAGNLLGSVGHDQNFWRPVSVSFLR